MLTTTLELHTKCVHMIQRRLCFVLMEHVSRLRCASSVIDFLLFDHSLLKPRLIAYDHNDERPISRKHPMALFFVLITFHPIS